MLENRLSKTYRFKLNDVYINVDIDNSLTDVKRHLNPDIMSYIKFQHYHMSYELLFIEDAPISIFSSGQSDKYQNCAVCIPPKFSHLSFRQKDYRIMFSFSLDNANTSGFSKFMKSLSSIHKPQKLETDETVMIYMRELSSVISSSGSIGDEVVISLLKLIFYKIYKINIHKQSESAPSVKQSYFLEIESILTFFQNDINLQTVADALHLSKKQTSRIVMSIYNKSLSKVVTEKRLNAACLLLAHTDYTISEIVEYINFPSESYFYQQFKKAYGYTPYKYKKTKASKTNSE